jgi:hypothetical protein
MRPGAMVMVVLLAALRAPVANAGPQDRQAAAAALFAHGIEDVQAGKLADGCDELLESVEIWPDSRAERALADCDAALGKLAEAWELWRDLSEAAPSAELRDEAARNAVALDRRLARVALRVGGVVSADLVVTFNGKPLRPRAVTEYRVEPGPLVVVATAPATAPWTRTYQAVAGAVVEVEIRLSPSADAARRRQSGRLAGLSLVGAGVVGLGVGVLFGAAARSSWNTAAEDCGGSTDHCKSAGFERAQADLDRARQAATISTVSVGVGAAVLAAGLIVYLQWREPRDEPAGAWRAGPLASSQALGVLLSRSLP